MCMKIGIYGVGRFGSTLAKLLKNNNLYLFDKNKDLSNCNKKDVLSCDIIFFCIPISKLENTIKENKKYISSESIIIDTCSVKEYPRDIITKYLPNNKYVATHPLFGPDSAFIKNANLVWIYDRININNQDFNIFKNIIEETNGILKELDCTTHDKNIASKQFITHSIGRLLDDISIEYEKYSTEGYKALLRVREQTTNDSLDLYKDMYKYNRFAKDIINNLEKGIVNIKSKIKE